MLCNTWQKSLKCLMYEDYEACKPSDSATTIAMRPKERESSSTSTRTTIQKRLAGSQIKVFSICSNSNLSSSTRQVKITQAPALMTTAATHCYVRASVLLENKYEYLQFTLKSTVQFNVNCCKHEQDADGRNKKVD